LIDQGSVNDLDKLILVKMSEPIDVRQLPQMPQMTLDSKVVKN